MVALKEYATDARSLQRCYQEAVVLRRAQHPGIVEIQALFEDDHCLYLQFPFYEGGTLREWVAERRPDDAALGTVLRLVLEALVHLHALKVRGW